MADSTHCSHGGNRCAPTGVFPGRRGCRAWLNIEGRGPALLGASHRQKLPQVIPSGIGMHRLRARLPRYNRRQEERLEVGLDGFALGVVAARDPRRL